ncbi:hypothetical protein EUTSA_v10027945mg [Eutrema salsugineum]|uniref:Uncharacterized protein n=1 Tax=Eutrema salsugineum TaxID=72664 RepID=V4LXX0_EUTSA|nr:hypothetical protein EUTSA_v10027945mg [Eutrema salsugineum]
MPTDYGNTFFVQGNVNSVAALEEALPMENAVEMDDNKNIAALEEALPMENAIETDANKNIKISEGTVYPDCGEVQVGPATEQEKKRKRCSTKHSPVLATEQSSNRSKKSRTLSKDQADATKSYPSTDGVSDPTVVELNSAALEEASLLENANEDDALLSPANKSDSSFLKKSTEVCDLAGNTLVLVGTIGSK